MLLKDRDAMAARALESFKRQTYENKCLLILNTGRGPFLEVESDIVKEPCVVGADALGMGALRNLANRKAVEAFEPDYIAHWDSDDWSHPLRLDEQIAFLEYVGQSIGLVGYRDMLFWDTRTGQFDGMEAASIDQPRNEAWMYRHGNPRYVVGSSMLYRTRVWQYLQFNEGDRVHEDHHWWSHITSQALAGTSVPSTGYPRMICSIHGSNTSEGYTPERMVAPSWMRVPEWDEHCGKVMKL